MWGFAGPLRSIFRRRSFVDVVSVACAVLYVASLVIDPQAALQPRGFNVFSPSLGALRVLGATGAVPWQEGQWWTLFTAIYLHGGLLHILFNVLWIRQLGPAVEDLYGPARLVIIFTVAGASRLPGVELPRLRLHDRRLRLDLRPARRAGRVRSKRGGAYGAMVFRTVRAVGAGPVRARAS